MRRHLLVGVLVTFLLGVGAVSGAGADPRSVGVVLAPASGPTGTAFTVSTSGLAAGVPVTLQAGSDTKTSTASARGTASASFTVPAGRAAGLYPVLVLEATGAVLARTSFRVTAPVAKIALSPTRAVPVTGSAASSAAFFKTSPGTFDAFKLSNAAPLWSFDEATNAPVVVSPRVFAIVPGTQVAVVARDATTGALQWRKTIGGPATPSNLVAMNGRLYVVVDHDVLVTLNPATGATIGSTDLSVPFDGGVTPELVGANGVLVLTTGNGAYGIDAATATVKYTNHDASWIHVIVASGRVVLESKTARLTSLKPT